ncbi:MAG TPA: ATP-binding protein [Halomicronema sp.]
MLFQQFKVFQKKEKNSLLSEQQNKPKNNKKTHQEWFVFLGKLSIAKKISYGYFLAIIIAVLGSSIGLIIGDTHQKKAQELLTQAYTQQNLILELEKAVLEMRSHPQRLITVLGDSIWFEYETSKFFGDVEKVKKNINDLENFVNQYPNNIAADPRELKNLLNNYKTATDGYIKITQFVWKTIDPASLKASEISEAQQQIITFTKDSKAIDISIEFDRVSESFNQIIKKAEEQKIGAIYKLSESEKLRLLIIISSMILAVMTAIFFGFYTSRQIARPLEWVNQVAQKVTEQSNFKLIVPVLTNDEVGSLAMSLNQLVQWVGEYTQQLETARQTLEQRVEERTQELTKTLDELKQTQAQLIQSEKMSSLGQLVGGLAHEINNPINFIYGNIEYATQYNLDLLKLVELYQQHYPPTEPTIEKQIESMDLEFIYEDLPQILASMKMGAERIKQIVLSLRNFSRLDESEKKEVDIHEGIDNTLLLLNSRLKKGISLQKQYKKLPLIKCYPAQLNQVFMNFLTNAIDAVTDAKWQEWATGHIEENKPIPTIVIKTENLEGELIRITIWNNGPAILPEIKSKLFDPFFTTKPVGQGTGLGLSISYQIIQKHQGTIQVLSEPETGTEFTVTLPKSYY